MTAQEQVYQSLLRKLRNLPLEVLLKIRSFLDESMVLTPEELAYHQAIILRGSGIVRPSAARLRALEEDREEGKPA
jgi:hypothetical protein